jgi:hypothetical protein
MPGRTRLVPEGHPGPFRWVIIGDVYERFPAEEFDFEGVHVTMHGEPTPETIGPPANRRFTVANADFVLESPDDNEALRAADTVMQPLLLAATLRSGHAVGGDFRGGSVYTRDGKQGIFGTSGAIIAGSFREDLRPLSAYASEALRIARFPEVQAAIRRLRAAMVQYADEAASSALAYLAVAGLIHYLGRQEEDPQCWRATGSDVGIAPDDAELLYHSLQPYRHHEADRAERKLQAMNATPWNLWDCRIRVAELIDGFLAHRESGAIT